VESCVASPGAGDEGYYLIVSALVPYKRVDLAVKAFSESGKRLVVIGEGTDLARLKSSFTRHVNNIKFLGWMGEEELSRYYDRCRALIFPGEEDFGIVPVEAQAHGKPIIAYAAGGVLETVIPLNNKECGVSPTGVFFYEQTPSALNRAVDMFEAGIGAFEADRIKENVARFSRDRFKREIGDYVKARWERHADTE